MLDEKIAIKSILNLFGYQLSFSNKNPNISAVKIIFSYTKQFFSLRLIQLMATPIKSSYGLGIQELQLTELLFKKSDVLGKTLSLPHQILTYIYNYQKSKINNFIAKWRTLVNISSDGFFSHFSSIQSLTLIKN